MEIEKDIIICPVCAGYGKFKTQKDMVFRECIICLGTGVIKYPEKIGKDGF